MRTLQALLPRPQPINETVKITQETIDEVIKDEGFRVGFEFEFHAVNAIDLISDDDGAPPEDFYSFNHRIDGEEFEGDIQHITKALALLRPGIAHALGVPEKMLEISLNDQHDYTKWTLSVDTSLYPDYGTPHYNSYNADETLAIELISPVLPLQQGLQALYRVREMIYTFRYGRTVFQTSLLTGVHINISHVLMKQKKLDYSKLALLLGDEHYLRAFERTANTYAQPILDGIAARLKSLLSRQPTDDDSQEHLERSHVSELEMLKLNGWDAAKVLGELQQLVPMEHHMSIDFSRLDSTNPYVEFRMAGNANYEDRMDYLVKMVLRFAALLKIGLDPDAHRREYLMKAYKLITSVVGNKKPTADSNVVMNKVRLFLKPIMVGHVRDVVKNIQLKAMSKMLGESDGIWLLYLIRIAIDMNQTGNSFVRRGLGMLMHDVFSVTPKSLMMILRDKGLLMRTGVLRQSDFAQTQTTNKEEWVNTVVLDATTGKPLRDASTGKPVQKRVPKMVPRKTQTPDRSEEILKQIGKIVNLL